MHAPVGRLGGHDVEMAVDAAARRRTGRCPRSGRRRWSGPGRAPAARGSRPASASRVRHVLGGGPLLAVAAAPVGGVDPDEVGGEPHDLVQRLGRQRPACSARCPGICAQPYCSSTAATIVVTALKVRIALVHGRRGVRDLPLAGALARRARRWPPRPGARRRTPAPPVNGRPATGSCRTASCGAWSAARPDVGGGPGRRAAHRRVPRHVVLDRDVQRLRGVARARPRRHGRRR